MRLAIVAIILLVAALPVATARPGAVHAASTLNRPEDPVVITGADVPSLEGVTPPTIVAFRYNAGWQQIPVQVDQRFTQTLNNVYNNVAGLPSNTDIPVEVYADPNTFTGADPNPDVDADDEIAFMAKDAGALAATSAPPSHTLAGSGVQLTITDPLQPGATGYVYLFEQDGTLDPGAGQHYVSYNFDLLSGNYKTTYDLHGSVSTDPNPGNPENTTVTTPYYSQHFSDRWADDQIHITAGGASGVNILDRHKALFAPGNCTRSEDTFDLGSATFPGEGAFVTNKVGPVRAIRSYIGANSGPNTQREQIFYAQREDIRTFLRVHSIPGIMDFFDYSPAASGMTYYNDLNTGGVTIDGVPDAPALGPIQWEMVTGPQGSLVMAGTMSTSFNPFPYTSYYEDNNVNPTTQCTGDAYAYGSSGVYVNHSIPSTDPGRSDYAGYLNTVRTMYFEPPGLTVAQAEQYNADATTPLAVSPAAWAPSPVGGRATQIDPRTLPVGSGSPLDGAMPWLAALGLAALGATVVVRRRAGR